MPQNNLTSLHLEHLRHFRIPDDLLNAAGVRSVSDREGREMLGINGKTGEDFSGILFPSFQDGRRVGACIRRDHPGDGGKAKYEMEQGCKHLYLPPGYEALLHDSSTPVVFVEAVKSVLALMAWSQRTQIKILPIAIGGCWGWKRKSGTRLTPNGSREPETGPSPTLDLITWKDREVAIVLDGNVTTNEMVRAAQHALVKEVQGRGASALTCSIPAIAGINRPDDLIAVTGDEVMKKVLESAEKPGSELPSGNLILTASGSPKALLANAITVLRESPEWQGVLGFDEFSLYAVSRKPAPWQKEGGANWTDFDDSCTEEWLQHHGILVGSRIAAEAVQTVAQQNPFHPIREYLDALVWGGTARLDMWLVTYLGAAEAAFSKAIGPRWMISAVARIEEPGCQVDHTLLLEGPQGIKKSTALQSLAGEKYFADHISDLDSKDARQELHGIWIFELAELAAVKRSLNERVKSFLTAKADHYRPPYGRRAIHVPRSNVFAGSVNDAAPFVDETGNRRFWPVRCGAINIPLLRDDRDQLWAEAFERSKEHESWWLETVALCDLASFEQEDRYSPGQWDSIIEPWLEAPTQRSEFDSATNTWVPVTPFISTRERVTITDILVHAIGKKIDRHSQQDSNAVRRCLVHAAWSPGRDRRGRFYTKGRV
jgi:predicted P-loop ATPase